MATLFIFGLLLLSSSLNSFACENAGEMGPYFEGDILGIAPSLLEGKAGIIGDQYRWPNATVPFDFEISYPLWARDSFLKATEYISKRTCIKFVPRSDHADYIQIVSGDGCSSYVGRMGIGMQFVNLRLGGCTHLGTIVHELMHSIGFFHEQSRPDRDDHVNIHWESIKPGKEHNFKKKLEEEVTTFGIKYDFYSLMHYGSNYFTSDGKDTVTTIPPGIPIGQRERMSAKDILKVNKMYNC